MSSSLPSDLVIRRCRVAEVEAILALWRESGATVSSTDTAEDVCRVLTASPAWVLGAEAGGRLVGTVIGTFDGWRGNLYRLVVHPAFRRRGVGRALVEEVLRCLARQGAKRITALVEKDHPLAMGFWQGIGFQQDGRVVRFVHNLGGRPPGG